MAASTRVAARRCNEMIRLSFSGFTVTGGVPGARKRARVVAALSMGAFGLCFLVQPGLAEQPSGKQMSVPSEEQALKIELANLEARAKDAPNDADAWTKLAPAYFKAGQLEKAAGAFRRVIELKAETEETRLGLAETLIFGNNGDISAAAKEQLNAAVQTNPKSGRGRFWLAIAAEQEGRAADAQKTYREMLEDDLTGPLRRMVTERLAGMSSTTHGGVPHGASAEGAPKGHQADIPGMVDKLAERLKKEGGSLENWLMLIRSYHVLQDDAKKAEALAGAKKQFASDAEAVAEIDRLVAKLSEPEAPEPDRAGGAKPEDVLSSEQPGAHGSMVQGMVARLAEKLKDSNGSLEDWLKLIRSYSVLKEADKAQQAAAAAQRQFASDAKALEQIGALLQEVKLTPAGAKDGTPK
jgi:cytochrome c-type biogenesis protein CcmH